MKNTKKQNQLYVVHSFGGEWTNDAFADAGPIGVFSSFEKAKDAIRSFMIEEMKSMTDSNEDYSILQFEELQEIWCEQTEMPELTIHVVPYDNGLLSIEDAGTFLIETPKQI